MWDTHCTPQHTHPRCSLRGQNGSHWRRGCRPLLQIPPAIFSLCPIPLRPSHDTIALSFPSPSQSLVWPQRGPTPRSGPGMKTPPHHGSRHGVDQAFVGQHGRHNCGSCKPSCSFPAEDEAKSTGETSARVAGRSVTSSTPSGPPPPEQPLPGRKAPASPGPEAAGERRGRERTLALIGPRLGRGAGQSGAAATTWTVGSGGNPATGRSTLFPRVAAICPVVLYICSDTGDFRKPSPAPPHISS